MKNLYEIISNASELYGSNVFMDIPAAEDNRENISYSKFKKEVDRQAELLVSLGVKAGDRVSFLTTKSPLQAYLFFAIWRINAIAVPVSESMGDEEVSFIINDADPAIVILQDNLVERSQVIATDRQTLSFSEFTAMKAETELPDCTIELDDTAVLIYTSGSTGRPKGVMLSHRNLMVNARSAGDAILIGDNERLVSLLPYWHSFALIAELVMIPLARGTVIFPKDRRDFARNLAAFNSTFMLVVPRMLAQFKLMIEKQVESLGQTDTLNLCLSNASQLFKESGILSQDPSVRTLRDKLCHQFTVHLKKAFGENFKFFIGGGAPLAQDLQEFFRDIDIPVLQGYGLTETSPVISCNTMANNKMGSSGQLVSWLFTENGGDYEFMDSEGNRSKDIEGELLVKGDCVMQGYWGHKDERCSSSATMQKENR